MEFVLVYALQVNLCKIRLKNVKADVQQDLLSLHLDFVFKDALVQILKALLM